MSTQVRLNRIEPHFDESFQALCFEELVALVEREAEALEVRHRADDLWEATLWIEEFPGTTWPLSLYSARAETAAAALLAAWGRVPSAMRGMKKGPGSC
jgi:hypothetical protein